MKLNSLCVYCGSSPGRERVFTEAAKGFGRLLAERGIRVVYGGGKVGLMGALADGALAAGGEVTGVIPGHLERLELGHAGITRLHVVSSMHERKMMMAELADGFVALPGGVGTIEEIFEVFTWTQLGLHSKPCGFLDVAGYYGSLSGFLDHMTASGFLRPDHRGQFLLSGDPEELLARMSAFEPLKRAKWEGGASISDTE